ncbi:MAG: type II secretion system F family protein [bacterium]
MPIFKFIGYGSDGSERKGTIEADGIKDAILRLRQDGVLAKDVHALAPSGKGRFFFRDRASRLSQVTRQLSILLAAGVPLNEALRSLGEENTGHWRTLLIDLWDSLASGSSLSRAMEEHRDVFPEFYIRMVQAGETGGMLDDVLMKLADFLEKEIAIRSKVSHAMIYPLFMFSIGIIVLSFVFTFVVPKIVVIFENAKTSLPLVTRALILISTLFHSYWWLMIAVALGAYAVFRKMKRANPERFDAVLLRIPVLRTLLIARFTRIFGFLLSGGIPLLKSLDLAAKSTGNAVLRNMLSEASKKITEGTGVAASLTTLPPVLRQMIATGEKTGKLPELLGRAADAYEEDFSKKVHTMLALLEPSMTVFMGVIVGFIVFAVLLPLFQMNQLIR